MNSIHGWIMMMTMQDNDDDDYQCEERENPWKWAMTETLDLISLWHMQQIWIENNHHHHHHPLSNKSQTGPLARITPTFLPIESVEKGNKVRGQQIKPRERVKGTTTRKIRINTSPPVDPVYSRYRCNLQQMNQVNRWIVVELMNFSSLMTKKGVDW